MAGLVSEASETDLSALIDSVGMGDQLEENGNESMREKPLSPAGRRGPEDADMRMTPAPATNFTITSTSVNRLSQPASKMTDLDQAFGGTSSEGHRLVLITFVGRCKGVGNVKKSFKSTFKLAEEIMPASGDMFDICESFDTYQIGGLYPLLHVCRTKKIVEKTKETEHFLEENALGDELVVDQALFQEVSVIEIPGSDADDFVLTVAAFKSIERKPSVKLMKHWKNWTGARAFFKYILTAGLDCQKMSFLVRDSPFKGDDSEYSGFYYLLLCEVGIRQPSDEGIIMDVLQRFRVRRWFGYQTIYRPHIR